MDEIKEFYKLNSYQTPLTEELKKSLPKEVWLDLIESITSIQFIKNIVLPENERGFAKDVVKSKDFNDGRIEVDITKPHVLENMDFFRERALFFDKHGKYTHLTPNPNPKSEYALFWKEELHRWKYGLVRPSDGEWIPGELYFYWNYSPIWLVETIGQSETSKKSQGERVRKFAKPWLGDYLFHHYVEQCKRNGKHGKLLKTRGCGMSFKAASWSPRNMYVLPGSGNPNFHLASDKSFLTGDKGIWGKILDNLDWVAEHTPLPRMRLVDRMGATLDVQLGFKDEYGSRKGLLSSVTGISLKDAPEKARGIRGPLIHYEEDGLFPNLETAWNVNRKAVEDGNTTFGFMIAAGTGGTSGASFEGSEKLFYNPGGYNIRGLKNVFDKNTKGDTYCGFFWGAYLNRKDCFEEINGEPDIIKALIEILEDRFQVKYNSTDPLAITQKKAEEPITPQEAIMRTEGTVFPVSDLKDYLESIMVKRDSFLAEHYVGELVRTGDGKLKWRLNNDKFPLRSYDKDNANREGCLEIFEMPAENANGEIAHGRYLAGLDPIDSDSGTSLFSILVMDSFTDRIVAEYSGRPRLAEEAYEISLRLLEFYNAVANYEKNLKGLFSYFDKKNALFRLCDTPQILKDMQMTKDMGYGNAAHSYNEKVITPDGIKTWGEIKIGDKLFNTYGGTTKVLDIPFDDVTDIYKISLKDGRTIEASENHLWKLINWNNKEETLTTSEILKYYYRYKGKYKEFKYYIPSNLGVDYEEKEIKLEPYVLGLLLGDGSPSNASKNQVGFTSNIPDLNEYKNYVNYEFKTYDDRHHRIVIPNIKDKLKELGLGEARCRTKFIPDVYKYNSKKVRLELLQGMMDTDGMVDKNSGNSSYCTTSKQLHEDVLFLVRSLGINCNETSYKNNFGHVYITYIYTDKPIFKLKRKLNKQKLTKTRSFKTAICNIEKIKTDKAKCVTVDSKDSCYLIGDFVTTHNSKGTHANAEVNKWGRKLQADWMNTSLEDEENPGKLKLHTLRGLAYIEECIKWNSDGNFDRVSAGGMLFILREDRYKRTQSAIANKDKQIDTLANDKFFNRNFNKPNAMNGKQIHY